MNEKSAVQKWEPKEVQQRERNELQPMSGEQMTNAILHYKEIQAAIDASMPEGIDDIGGKKYRNKTYWRAAARAFRLNVDVIGERREQYKDDFTWHITCRASFQNGDCAVGTGSCSASEKKGRQRTEHNVRAHAETRAYNRAVSNLVGFGEVTSEEIDRNNNGNRQTRQQEAQRRADQQAQQKPLWHAELWAFAKEHGINDTEWSGMRRDVGITNYNIASREQQRQMRDLVNEWIADQEAYTNTDVPGSVVAEIVSETESEVVDESETATKEGEGEYK